MDSIGMKGTYIRRAGIGMLKKARSLIHGQEAAATVFFLIAGTSLLILFLAIFNYGRYLLAVTQAEAALEASASSVLSFYHPKLTGETGLYALDTHDLSLAVKGREYFSDNLGSGGAVNGQRILDYALSFPAESRLSQEDILTAQAVDMQRIEAWTNIAQDLLQFLGKADWLNGLKAPQSTEGLGQALGLPAAADGGADMEDLGIDGSGGAEPDWGWEKPDWLLRIEEIAGPRPAGRISFLQFLLPYPPGNGFINKNMPGEGLWDQISRLISEQADYWQSLFYEPTEAVGAEEFLPEATERITDCLTALTDGLTAALRRLGDKIVFNDYLLGELDFATNKPVLNRYFSRCEVEYVLCGFNNSWDNVRSVALQLFLLRTSLYVLKSLIGGEIVDEVSLAAAAIEGAIKGGAEVEKLYAGERVPAFPGASFTMSYKDHLRLLLLCQREADQRRALQKLTQVNLWHWAGGGAGTSVPVFGNPGAGAGFAEYALSRYATEVRIAVETEVPLWPFGSVSIRREGAMGYDKPFTLLPS